MQNISSLAELKAAIQLLQAEHDIKGQLLKNEMILTYHSLKPINVLKNTLHEISSPTIVEEMSGTGIGILGGFLSKKIFVGTSGNLIRKLLGSVLQLGVTTVVAQNSGLIQTIGMFLVQRFIHKHKIKPADRASESHEITF